MSFDRIARHYERLESIVFGEDLQRIRCSHMETFLDAESILLLGDGDGRFLKALLDSGSSAKIICVDSSQKMLKLAESVTKDLGGNVCFVFSKIEDFNLPDSFIPDVIGAHFFLDCFREDEILVILSRISGWCKEHTKFVVSDFSIPEKRGLTRFINKLLTWKMIVFFRTFTGISAHELPKIGQLLSKMSYRCLKKETLRNGFISSWVWQL
ncbi:MAG: class I SAM-dependent methyltransferase [Verrucomicrobiota bacterium]|nr:class I SAM-dependent methyltransferase [Verrucomicrobiota bacterium]